MQTYWEVVLSVFCISPNTKTAEILGHQANLTFFGCWGWRLDFLRLPYILSHQKRSQTTRWIQLAGRNIHTILEVCTVVCGYKTEGWPRLRS